jgi:cellulose biosynthesis protein BcsQ
MEKNTVIASYYTQKGGSGKTTLTHMTSIALAADKKKGGLGKSVLVLDADTQKSLVKALENIRAEKEDANLKPPYDLLYCPITDMKSALRKHYGKYDYIFIDLPGTMDIDGVRTALLACDIVFLPIQPSQLDVSSAEDTVLKLQEIQKYKKKEGGDMQYYCFINQAEPKKISTKSLIEFISTNGLSHLETPMLRYERYKYLLNDYENILGNSKWSSEEHSFSKFFDEIKSKLLLN